MKKASRLFFGLLLCLLLVPDTARAAFGLTTAADSYTVDTGAGLVFKVLRTDNGSNSRSPGDLTSMVYRGVEYQDQSRGSQINSGFDYLYNGVSAVAVDAKVIGTDYIRITVVAGNLTHYYMARRGYPHIYMATYFTTEPETTSLCRFIVRIPHDKLPDGPPPADLTGTTTTIEAADIFGLPDGETRSKHYSNMRLKDWSYIGATGTNVGVWVVRDSYEGGSGGPFYRCLLDQGGSDQELTYIVNYGEAQTEAYRTGILNGPYTLVFTDGSTPPALDTSWVADMGLTGFIGASARGEVTGSGLTGRDTAYDYTVGFSNANAQYYADASAADGSFTSPLLIPGTYTMRVYKNELAVHTASVAVTAGKTTTLGVIAIDADPSQTSALWRIGNWDGSPGEFLNADKITTMHPSDVRISTWTPGAYVVGTSNPATGIPCYQWKDVNADQVVRFNLTAAQVAASTVRVGITTAYASGRPNISVNSWTSPLQSSSTQPNSRTLTVGSYRGNNTTYTFNVPASALVAGTNTLTVYPISGSGGSGFLSAGYSLDCIDMLQDTVPLPPPAAPATLTASGGDTLVTLNWAASSGATSYTLSRATAKGGPYAIRASGLTATTYADTQVVNGTAYHYIVTASNANGTSAPSGEVSATPIATPPPAAPATLTASGGDTLVSLSWTASSNATSYTLSRATASNGPFTVVAAGLTTTVYADKQVVNGTTYYYTVTASNAGGASAPSREVSATPGIVIPVVTATAAGDATAVAGGKPGKVFIERTGDLKGDLVVRYKVKGSARAGIDYKRLNGTVTIRDGASAAKVKIKALSTDPGGVTHVVKVKLLPGTDGVYVVGKPKTAKIRIIED